MPGLELRRWREVGEIAGSPLKAKGRQTPASPLHMLRFRLAVGTLVSVRREQPSAAARLGAVDTISVRRLAILGLLGLRLTVLLAVLRIRWGVRHISLGYDAGKLGEEGVGRGGVAAAGVGNAGAKAEQWWLRQ